MSGVYAIEQSTFDLAIVLAAGVLGYVMRQLRFPTLPMVLGVVLGFMVESNYRRSMVISGGDHMIFLQDKVALGLLILTIVLLIYSIVSELRSARAAKREEAA
jgi:putative tricarboxylic transport membrane protein